MFQPNRHPLYGLLALLLITLWAAPGFAALSMELGYDADETGIDITYRIPLVGNDDITLEETGDNASVPINLFWIPIANLDFTLINLSADNATLGLEASTPYTPDTYSGQVDLPYGEIVAGADLALFNRALIPHTYQGDSARLDLSLMVSPFGAAAAAYINVPELFDGQLENLTADVETLDNGTMVVSIPGEPASASETAAPILEISLDVEPNFLISWISGAVSVNLPPYTIDPCDQPGAPDPCALPTISIPLPSFGFAIPRVPLINGSYHIWLQTDMNLADLLPIPQL